MITFLALLRLHFLAHALGTVNLRELVEKINAANATWQVVPSLALGSLLYILGRIHNLPALGGIFRRSRLR